MASTKTKSEKSGGIKVTGQGKYVLVPLDKIQIVERPAPGQETTRIFYNPRSLDSFQAAPMANLLNSIRTDGLQQPPVVRAFTEGGRKDPIIKLELVAGERRLRSILKLVETNELCFDDESETNIPAEELYGQLPVRLLYNISDEKALKIAFLENNEHQSLSIKEEIDLVERLLAMDFKQEEISDLLGTNVTWVSQTHTFRTELPSEAFQKLLDGKMTRHVAVRILSYHPEDREKVYEESVIRETQQTEQKRIELDQAILEAEDEEEILSMRESEAEKQGDSAEAKRQKRKKDAAAKRLESAKDKRQRVEDEAGTIRQGHLADGAVSLGISPKKAKILSRSQIEQFFVELPRIWVKKNDKVDPVCEEVYPVEILETVIATAEAILSGQHDPGRVMRSVMVAQGRWQRKREEPEHEPLDVLEGDELIADE